MVVIPFTLCSLLLCNDMTGERARVAQSPPPWRPGLPAVNRRFAVPSAYSFRLIGYGRRQRPCKAALSAHPCASPRPAGNASAIYSRTRASLIAFDRVETTLLLLFKNYWGSLSHREREKTTLYSRCRDEKIPQLMKLVADLRRFFELQVLRVLHHLPFQLVDLLLQRFWRQHDGIFFHH